MDPTPSDDREVLAQLDALAIGRDKALALSGFVLGPPELLTPRGSWTDGLALGGGVAAGVVVPLLFLLAPSTRAPLMAIVVALVVLYLVLAAGHEILATLALGAVAVSCLWLGARIALGPESAWRWGPVVALLAVGACMAITRESRRQRRLRSGLDALARLHEEVARFDTLVRAMGVAARLEALDRSDPLAPRWEPRLHALRRAHAELVRALEAERILRENGEVLAKAAAAGHLGLLGIEAARIAEARRESAARVAEALSAAEAVRRELGGWA